MKFKEFDYDVFMMVELNGHELLFLREKSEHHYDGVCKAAGALGGFLYGFCNHWLFASLPCEDFCLHNQRTDLDRVETIRLSGRELDILGKICEFNPDPNRLLKTSDFIQLLNQRKSEYKRISQLHDSVQA